MKKVGRKQNDKISNNDMLLALEEYINEFPNERININKLAHFSGIERHYWYSRKEINEKINSLNTVEYEQYTLDNEKDMFKLPDIDSFIEVNYGSKRKMKAALGVYFNMLQTFFESSCESYKLKKERNTLLMKLEKSEQLLKDEKEKRKECEKLVEYYKNEYYTICYRSSESGFRRENGIKDNVIDIENYSDKAYSTKEDDLDSLLNRIKD